jgi:hypothetical protein
MAFDPASGNTVLFGGETSPGNAVQDTWVFDGIDWAQIDDTGPTPRTQHAMAYDAERRRLVLFGGLQRGGGQSGVVGDTWEWDGTAWTRMATTGPPPRCEHVMAYDRGRKKTVMFGGRVITGDLLKPTDDTWEWNGTAWTQVAGTGPTARAAAAMAIVGGILVLQGGLSTKALGDTWQWNSGAWSKLQDFGPSRRSAHAITYDSYRTRIVMFGGEADPDNPQVYFGDTWEASAGPFAENLIADRGAILVSQVVDGELTIEFDILSRGVETKYSMFIELRGKRSLIESSTIPPSVTHAKSQVPFLLFGRAARQLGIVNFPTTVAIVTDLGDASVPLILQ